MNQRPHRRADRQVPGGDVDRGSAGGTIPFEWEGDLDIWLEACARIIARVSGTHSPGEDDLCEPSDTSESPPPSK